MNKIKNTLRKFKNVARERISIFIDAANLEQSVKDMYIHPRDLTTEWLGKNPEELGWSVDYRKLKSFFEKNSNLIQISFYSARFNSQSHDDFLTVLKDAGYEMCTKPVKQYADHTQNQPHRKANFDVEIAVDAVANMQYYDTVILFSGDSDFAYLLYFLRRNKKRAIIFSRKGHIAKELFSTIDEIPVLDKYFDIVDFRHELLKITLKKPKTPL